MSPEEVMCQLVAASATDCRSHPESSCLATIPPALDDVSFGVRSLRRRPTALQRSLAAPSPKRVATGPSEEVERQQRVARSIVPCTQSSCKF